MSYPTDSGHRMGNAGWRETTMKDRPYTPRRDKRYQEPALFKSLTLTDIYAGVVLAVALVVIVGGFHVLG